MNQVKQIHKLRSEGYGIKTIASMLGISKNTVKSYLRKTDELGLSDEQLTATDNPILADQLKPVSAQGKDNYQAFLQRAEHYVKELAKRKQTHVTRMILWEEDSQAGLSRFCFHLRRYLKSKQPSTVMVHRPGEKMFVDFAGDKLYYIDSDTGKRVAAEVLLVTLGISRNLFFSVVDHPLMWLLRTMPYRKSTGCKYHPRLCPNWLTGLAMWVVNPLLASITGNNPLAYDVDLEINKIAMRGALAL